jgi:hypothetical protein
MTILALCFQQPIALKHFQCQNLLESEEILKTKVIHEAHDRVRDLSHELCRLFNSFLFYAVNDLWKKLKL